MRTPVRRLAWCWMVAAAGCISAAPPAPPVRWFDPLPAGAPAAAPSAARPAFRVDAAPFLGREFVVRVGPREVAVDAQHCWIAEPRQLVAAALASALPGPEDDRVVRIVVERFELDVQGPPRARVRLQVVDGAASRVIDEAVDAASRAPEAFAAAMSDALGRALSAMVSGLPRDR